MLIILVTKVFSDLTYHVRRAAFEITLKEGIYVMEFRNHLLIEIEMQDQNTDANLTSQIFAKAAYGLGGSWLALK